MTKIVGILNITPDSFSEDGLFLSPRKIESHLEQMLQDKVSVIDIGAESTRPGATLLSSDQEAERLDIVFLIIKNYIGECIFSIDSRHHVNIEKALNLGFNWVNDVSAFNDKKILDLAKRYNADLVLTHTLGVPANPKMIIDKNLNTIKEVLKWAEDKINFLCGHGIKKEKIIFDPGIGFGKDANQSLELIKTVDAFKKLGLRLMYGHSRKSFLKIFTDLGAKERDFETLAVSSFLALHGVDYIRVHNTTDNIRVVKVTHELIT